MVFPLPYSKYKGMKICFYSCRYQNQNFSLMPHFCCLCSTRVALVLRSSCSYLTRVASVALVLHSCRSCLTLVLYIRLDQSNWSAAWFHNISIALKLVYNRNKLFKTLHYWSRNMLNLEFLDKGLGMVSPLYFVYDFSRKMFLML